jgi:hypothetical protein
MTRVARFELASQPAIIKATSFAQSALDQVLS